LNGVCVAGSVDGGVVLFKQIAISVSVMEIKTLFHTNFSTVCMCVFNAELVYQNHCFLANKLNASKMF
jgi:hypothetical protein